MATNSELYGINNQWNPDQSARSYKPYTRDELAEKYGELYTAGADTRSAGRTALAGTSGADESFLSDGEYAILQQLREQFAAAQAAGDQAGMDAAHEEAERVRASHGYSGGADGSQFIAVDSGASKSTQNTAADARPVSGGSAEIGVTAPVSAANTRPAVTVKEPEFIQPDNYKAEIPAFTPSVSGGSAIEPVQVRTESVLDGIRELGSASSVKLPETPALEITGKYAADTAGLKSMLEQWKAAATEQKDLSVDSAVQKAVLELERALEDAQPQFLAQAESVSRDERQSMDNAALYAELRGDRGGIGKSQYDAIQAAAARNRLAVQQAQTKLAADTARQIADLRAQGEFDKADAALSISQSYLSQLTDLEKWAQEHDLSAAQFEASMQKWQADYEMSLAKLQADMEQNAWNTRISVNKLLLDEQQGIRDAQLSAQKLALQEREERQNAALNDRKLQLEAWRLQQAMEQAQRELELSAAEAAQKAQLEWALTQARSAG